MNLRWIRLTTIFVVTVLATTGALAQQKTISKARPGPLDLFERILTQWVNDLETRADAQDRSMDLATLTGLVDRIVLSSEGANQKRPETETTNVLAKKCQELIRELVDLHERNGDEGRLLWITGRLLLDEQYLRLAKAYYEPLSESLLEWERGRWRQTLDELMKEFSAYEGKRLDLAQFTAFRIRVNQIRRGGEVTGVMADRKVGEPLAAFPEVFNLAGKEVPVTTGTVQANTAASGTNPTQATTPAAGTSPSQTVANNTTPANQAPVNGAKPNSNPVVTAAPGGQPRVESYITMQNRLALQRIALGGQLKYFMTTKHLDGQVYDIYQYALGDKVYHVAAKTGTEPFKPVGPNAPNQDGLFVLAETGWPL
jgi:hypothetical protein